MTGDQLLQHAAAIVRDRRCLYGDPSDLFERLAVRWSQVLACKVTPAQVGLCLIDLKLARSSTIPRTWTAWLTSPATQPAFVR